MTRTGDAPWEIDLAPPRPPWTQMAIDRWLLHRAELGGAPPVLRLYQWDRPTLTLGRHQEVEGDGIDLVACGRRGVAAGRSFTAPVSPTPLLPPSPTPGRR